VDFEEALRRGHLTIATDEPGAGDLVRRWRVFCRHRGVPCVCVAVEAARADIEVRLPATSPFLANPTDEFMAHPRLPLLGGRGSGSYTRTKVTMSQVHVSELESTLDVIRSIVQSHYSEERRIAAARREPPLVRPKLEPRGCISISLAFDYVAAAPEIRMRLAEHEYAVLNAALERLFVLRPLAIAPQAGQDLMPLPPGYTAEKLLRARFPELNPETLESWKAVQGPFHWEPRFSVEGGAFLRTGEGVEAPCFVSCGRPGFNVSRDEALVWLAEYSRETAFRGFAVLHKHSSGAWQVSEVSHDEDWERTEFEPWKMRTAVNGAWTQPFWRALPIRYPEGGPEEFFSPWDVEASDALYRELSGGGGPEELRTLEIIPTLHGADLSLAQLLILAQARGELYWDVEPSAVSHALVQGGHQVVRWGGAGACWLGKLLAYLSTHYGCDNVRQVWAAPKPVRVGSPKTTLNLDVLRNIFRRGGLLNLQFEVAELGPGVQFVLRLGDEELCRRRHTAPFHTGGTVLIGPDELDNFCTAPFRFMAALCEWGDPPGQWVDRLWHATGVETAWAGQDEF
jgi:hypothetical protein